MKKLLLLFAFTLVGYMSKAQCLVDSLTISTGYNPLTGRAVTPGLDGGTPVPDPKWKMTAVSPSVAVAISMTGLIEVLPGGSADVITRVGAWATNPPAWPGGWISCLNSSTYTTDGTGPTGTQYDMVLSRSFTLCTADSIRFELRIAADNYVEMTDVDGTPLGFAMPPSAIPATYSTYATVFRTLYLTAGSHTLNIKTNNYNTTSPSSNPTGLNVYGAIVSATGINSIITENNTSCSTYACTAPCNIVTLPDSASLCAGTTITLPGAYTGSDSVLSIAWTPRAGISDTTILRPTLTTATSGYRYLTVKSLIPYNFVINGDFSQGNNWFTSSYTYSPPGTSVLPEGQYSVDFDPFDVHTGFTSFGDHTTGTGDMMIINGASTPVDVWCQTINVTPNTDYDFSAWFANCSSVTIGPDVPTLQFRINGTLIGTPIVVTAPPATWVNFFTTWNSGTNTTATICIYDANTSLAGNDFVIDDISFKEICTAKDSIYITATPPDTTTFSHDTSLCITSAPLRISAPPGFATYRWNTGATTASINVSASGVYWVYSRLNCTVLIDTFHVNFIPVPVVDLGNDTAFCIGNTLVLSSTQPTGTTYLWNTGSTGDSIHVSTSGTYWLRLDNGCVITDSIHVLISPYPMVDLGPDTFSCLGSSIPLSSSVTYTSPTFLWSDGSTTPSILAALSGTYHLTVTVGGCASSDTINVTIIYDTLNFYNNDTAICMGKGVQTLVTANPSARFQWIPTAGIANSRISSPLIVPDTSAMYYLHVTLPGCPDMIDSFFIDVQPNPIVHFGGNRFVCRFDTLHLHSTVEPSWYTHYQYRWRPANFIDDSTATSVLFTAGDSTKQMLFVTTPAGCKGADSAMIMVHPANFGTISKDTSICPRDSIQLFAWGGVSYLWKPSMYLSDSTSAAPWLKAITSQRYTVLATNKYGCLDTLNVNVTVWPAATILLPDSVLLYPGETYQISPQTNCTYFTWFPPIGLSDQYSSNPISTPEMSTKYTVDASTAWGCTVKDSISLIMNTESLISVPNAFTPGSGPNGKLRIIKHGMVALNYFRIYNRWGNMVYETTNIEEGWDGNYKGAPQPFGVYVYQIEAVTSIGTTINKHGNITLIR